MTSGSVSLTPDEMRARLTELRTVLHATPNTPEHAAARVVLISEINHWVLKLKQGDKR